MSDPRLTPANERIMAAHLPADGSGRPRVTGTPMQIARPVVDLLRRPGGPRDRQLLYGDAVDLYETRDGDAFVQARKDGYVGYLPRSALTDAAQPTHRISALASHLYARADFKSPDRACLSLGAHVTVHGVTNGFGETPDGYVPMQHLSPAAEFCEDPVQVAARFLGIPYLWGGNSHSGLDCSGLVQVACLACGIPCPGDSDQQEATLGTVLPPQTPPRRGDLMFWNGHVAWVASHEKVLHANAHSMSTAYEPIADAIARIAAGGDGPVTAHKRL